MTEQDSPADDTSMEQPQVESAGPTGGGVGSQSYAGGNKRDPVSASPTLGQTIAGRDISTGSPGGNAAVDLGNLRTKSTTENAGETREDRPDGGVTGTTGKGATSGHDVTGQGVIRDKNPDTP